MELPRLLTAAAAAADDRSRAVADGAVRDVCPQPENDVILAAGPAEAERCCVRHGNVLDDVRFTVLRIALQREIPLREEYIFKARAFYKLRPFLAGCAAPPPGEKRNKTEYSSARS